MSDFRFYQPIDVRYGDLDPQGHVNNAKYLTYLEQARIAYFKALGLWRGGSWLDLGVILADAHLTYRAPILFDCQVRVGARVVRLGNKSLTMINRLDDAGDGREFATAVTVLVAYDYRKNSSILIPEDWREKIAAFEGL